MATSEVDRFLAQRRAVRDRNEQRRAAATAQSGQRNQAKPAQAPRPARTTTTGAPLPMALQQPPAPQHGPVLQGMLDRTRDLMLNPQAPQQPAPAPIPAALQRPPVAVGSEAATMSPAEIQTLGDQRALDRLGQNHQQLQQASQFTQNPSQAGDTGRAAFDAMDPQTQGTLRQAARSNEDAARSRQNTNEINRRLDTVRSMNAGVRPDAQGFTADERDQLGRQNFDYSGFLTPEQKALAHRMGGGRNLAFGGPPIGQLPAALSQPADPDRVAFAQQQLAQAEAAGPSANQQRFYDSVKQRAEAARPQYEAMLAREQQQRDLIARGQVRANAARGNLTSQGMVAEMDQQRQFDTASLMPRALVEQARLEALPTTLGFETFNTMLANDGVMPNFLPRDLQPMPQAKPLVLDAGQAAFDPATGQQAFSNPAATQGPDPRMFSASMEALIAQRKALAGLPNQTPSPETAERIASIDAQIEQMIARMNGGAQMPQGTMGGAQQAQGGGQSQPVQISSDDEFNQLASGAEFIGPDGVKRRKP